MAETEKPTPKARRTAAERLAALEQQKAALDRRAAAIRAKLGDEERKMATREKVIVGGAVLAAVEAGTMPREKVAALIDATVLNAPTRAFLRERGWAIKGEDPPDAAPGQAA